MESMFSWSSLTSLNVSNWDTSKVTNMDNMFQYCNGLKSLDLSSWRTSQVTDMAKMFHGCQNLTSLDLSNWNTFSAYESYMFTNCNRLESLYLTNCNFSTVNRIINMKDFPKNKIDGVIRTIHWNNDNWKNEIALIPPPTNWMYSFMLHDLVAIYTVNDSSKTSPGLVEGKADDWGETVLDNGNGTYKVIVTASYGPTRIKFNNSSTTNTTLLSVDYIDTSNMTSMNNMFSKCTKLKSVNTSNFDTDQVTDMESMFSNCDSLTSLDLSSFDTNQVTNMSYMFSGCDYLTSLDLSNWNTSNVTNMRMMFASCTSLTSLNLSSFDTSNVRNMNSMFYNCKSLTTLNLSNFDTNNATNMDWMFDGCTSLQELRLDDCSKSDISKIITSTSFPTNAISGVTKTIYCRESEAAGLTKPGNWVFSSYVS
jgi:surface protein